MNDGIWTHAQILTHCVSGEVLGSGGDLSVRARDSLVLGIQRVQSLEATKDYRDRKVAYAQGENSACFRFGYAPEHKAHKPVEHRCTEGSTSSARKGHREDQG